VCIDSIGVIELMTLRDGGQDPSEVADALISFFGEAQSSLHAAVYDIRVSEEVEERGRAELRKVANERDVDVRLVYELEEGREDPLPAPPRTDPAEVEAERFPSHGVSARDGLMHHKYVVRDGRTVWTGSLNWTEDSWRRQENVVVVIESEPLAHAFTLNFDELWNATTVETTGRVEPRRVDVGGATVRPWFCPGYGDALAHRIAKHIGKARRRVRIASPVITSGPILGTLVEVVKEQRCDLAGVVDDTQVDQVFRQWQTNGVSEWKIPLLHSVITGAPFSGKESTPWSPTSVHDFMHAKVVVADDTTFIGSFNLSRAGERNAENVVEIRDSGIADQVAAFVDEVRERYPRATPPGELRYLSGAAQAGR
jgi:phosphatidylserine/phosphatidylglycerophosphate/cardiolipin synthase-like enzyme